MPKDFIYTDQELIKRLISMGLRLSSNVFLAVLRGPMLVEMEGGSVSTVILDACLAFHIVTVVFALRDTI